MLGDQDENLETQSSLGGNTQTAEEQRSRFSRSLASSTQKSDKETHEGAGNDSAAKVKVLSSEVDAL